MNQFVELREKIDILDNQLKQLGSYLNAAEEKVKSIQEESNQIKYVMNVLLQKKIILEKHFNRLKAQEDQKPL